jgi:hypothetical protein
MAKCFETWTVLPHSPLEKLGDNLWRVGGKMPDGKTTRAMTLARLGDGRLLIHNAIALEEPLMAEIEAWGKPSFIVVPNGFHRQDAKIYKQRYPGAVVLCPRATRSRVARVVNVDGSYDDAPKDDAVRLTHLEGCKEGEGVLEVRSSDGASLVFADALCNLPPTPGLVGFLLAPTGKASVPRAFRLLVTRNKGVFKEHLTRLASIAGLKRIIVSHGSMITDRVADTLRTAAAGVS